MENIIKIVIAILIMFVLFFIYRWFIYFIHELGHVIVGKIYGYECKLTVHASKFLMPRFSTKIRGTKKITPQKDFWFTINGVLLAELMNLLLLFLFHSRAYLLLLVISHIPILFTDIIPIGNNDGKWIVEDMVIIHKFNEYKKKRFVTAIMELFAIVFVGSVFATVMCYLEFSSQNIYILFILPLIIIFYGTTLRYFIRCIQYLRGDGNVKQ